MTARRLPWFGLALGLLAAGAAAASEVWVVELDGAITPATASYFTRALGDAEDAGAAALVVRLDTPGGLDQAMRDMIKAILASRIPVVTYVAPSGTSTSMRRILPSSTLRSCALFSGSLAPPPSPTPI